MGLRDLANQELADEPRTSGLRSFASAPSVGEPPTSKPISINGAPARREEIGPTPRRNPVQSALIPMDEMFHGLAEGVVPFGLGKRMKSRSVLDPALVDHAMETDRSLVRKPDVKNIPVVGEAVSLFNIPNQYTDEVKSRLMSRKMGRLMGEFARYAVIDRVAQGMKLPGVMAKAFTPKAQQLGRQMFSGAISGVTEDVPEDNLEDALIGMAFRGGVGAVAMPAFNKLLEVGGGMMTSAARDRTLWALREAREMMFTGKQAWPEHLKVFMATVAKLRARRLMREAAVKSPAVAEEAAKLEKEFEKIAPKAKADVAQQPIDIKGPEVKAEQKVQAQSMPDDKLRNEIVVLEMRAKEGGPGASSAGQAARELRTELNKRNLEKARQAKTAKRDPKVVVEKAGAKFKGVQPGYKKKDGTMLEGLVMFDDPQSGTTLVLKESQLTEANVRQKLAASRRQYAEAAKKKSQPQKPELAPRVDLKAKTSGSQFAKIAESGTGVIKEIAQVLEPGADPIQRANTFSKVRRILDRSSKKDVHVGTIPAGGADAKTRIKWEEFFPDELKLEYRRQGSMFNVYVSKDNANVFGPPSGLTSPRIDPVKEGAQIAELEAQVEKAVPGKVEGLKEYASKNKLGNKQYAAFLQNWLKKNAPSEVPTKISPEQAKQGFTKPAKTSEPVQEATEVLSEDDFFGSIGATKEKPKDTVPTRDFEVLVNGNRYKVYANTKAEAEAQIRADLAESKRRLGPVMALKDKTTGKVYSDPQATLHSDILIKNNLNADNVERGVIVNGVYKRMDDSGIAATRDLIHELGDKANGLSIKIQNMLRENPDNPEVPALRAQFKDMMTQLDDAKQKMIVLANQQARPAERGFVGLGGGGTSPGGGEPGTGGTSRSGRPAPQAPEGVRPRQFPDKGDIKTEGKFSRANQDPIKAATVFFDISGKTRGKLTIPEINALAKKGQLTIDQIASLPEGTALPAEEIKRAHMLVDELFKLAKREVDIALRMPEDPVAQANAAATVKLAIDSLTSTRGAEAEIGRALRVLRTSNAVREFSTAEAQSILDGLATNNFNTYLKAFSEAVDRADVSAAKRSLSSIRNNKNWFDKLVNFSNALFLTSPQTDIVNITGNSLALLTSMVEIPFVGAVDAVNSAIRKTPRTRLASEAVVEAFSVIEGIREGVGEFAHGMLAALKGQQADPGKAGELMGGGVGQGAMEFTSNLIFSRLSATDMFFKAVKRRMSINAQAYRMAILENLEGTQMMNRIHELRTRPTKRMREEADARALEFTYQEALGGISKKINEMRNDPHMGSTLRILLPFFKTPVNLMRFAGRRAPLALFPGSKAFRQMTGNASPAELTVPRASALPSDVQASQSEAIGRFIMGSMISMWVAIETLKGNITGVGPESRKTRELMEGQGWMGSSFKVGNSYRSYRRFEPFAYIVQPIATMTERLMKSGKEPTYQDIQDVVGASVGFVLDSTFLHQLKETVDWLSGKNPDFGANLVAGRVAIPGLQYLNRVFFDPVIRKPKGLAETLQSRIPGQSQKVAPDIDVLGNERTLSNRILPFQHSDIKENRALDEMLRLGVTLPDQGPTFMGEQLSVMERSLIEKIANSTINKALNDWVASDDYEMLTDEERKKEMKTTIKGIREGAAIYYFAQKNKEAQ